MRSYQNKASSNASGDQSWHNLTNRATKTAVSHSFKLRRIRTALKIGSIILLISLFFGILIFLVKPSAHTAQKSIASQTLPIQRIEFNTNGVLTNRWLSSIVQLKLGTRLAEADISIIKDRLEAVGQVQFVSVERVFPDALRIDMKEHVPIMRLVVEEPNKKRELRIISSVGTIYKGIGYDKGELRKLPFLRPYLHHGGNYLPLQGIEHVAKLLQICRQKYPLEYKNWQVVSLKSYTGINNLPGEIIEVQAANLIGKSQTLNITRLIFSTTTDFNIQLDRLGHIREVSLSINDHLKSVDLSLRDAAAVQFISGRTSLY